MQREIDISELQGKTFKEINEIGNEIEFIENNGQKYTMYHPQTCCEDVSLEDIVGDLDDLIGVPLVVARKDTSCVESSEIRLKHYLQDNKENKHNDESFTWTFYNFRTIKGSVTLRWYGSSNGYYSEEVYIFKIIKD